MIELLLLHSGLSSLHVIKEALEKGDLLCKLT